LALVLAFMLLNLFSKTSVWFLILFFLPTFIQAQTVHQDFQETIPAEVLEVVSESEQEVIGTGATKRVQEVKVKLKAGDRKDQVVTIENEVVVLEAGDDIYVSRIVTIGGEEYITYLDFERRPVLFIVLGLFIALLLFFSRWQGVRALLSLAGSVAAIFFLLVPALLAGYNPAATTIAIAAIIMAFVLFGTHGFCPRSYIAFAGTVTAVAVTSAIAIISVDIMRLTGFSSDASVYLNFATNGQLDLGGLLIGSIIIGLLGVLDDVSVTQASVVQELKSANPSLNMFGLYSRAINVGRDHIGSLVNTLALAYTGVALPLILLYSKTESSWLLSLNQEVIAVELLRIIVGSIGLILAVPATTAVAAWYWHNREVVSDGGSPHHHHHHH